MNKLALPSVELLQQQAAWLAPARARLLRSVGIARRCSVLDLGAGHGVLTAELLRRCGGSVTSVDREVAALHAAKQAFEGARRVGGDALSLPFADASFDLVFSQLTLLWVASLEAALHEISRVLAPGGALVALEPDYGGMIEHPPDTAVRELWLSALPRAGANPYVGRMLPALLSARDFDVRVGLFDSLYAPDPARFDFLRDLPLVPEETARLHHAEESAAMLVLPWAQIAHLPFFMLAAIKRG